MDPAKLRSWWWRRQGLDGSLSGQTESQALEKTGWARSVGGSGPYLTLRARTGASRTSIDRAVANVAIHELPAARNCTYVVPESDFALALKVGEAFSDGDMKTARKLGVTDAEVDRLGRAIVDALGDGPLDPEQLKGAVGKAVRNLGEEGKKKGVTTTLPLALGRLQTFGEIRRIPINGRLDQQRYKYAAWRLHPCKLSAEEAYTELARRYFEWIAPATPAQFQWFSGLGVKAAKAAVEPLGLVPLEAGDDRLISPKLRDELMSYRAPAKPQYSLIGSLDGLFLLRRDLKAHLAEEDFDRQVMTEKGCGAASGLMDLPSNAIVDRGRVVGLWEYDPEAQAIAWMSFVRPDAAMKKALEDMTRFVREELGDARSFSLDSPKSRAPRIAGIRALAAHS